MLTTDCTEYSISHVTKTQSTNRKLQGQGTQMTHLWVLGLICAQLYLYLTHWSGSCDFAHYLKLLDSSSWRWCMDSSRWFTLCLICVCSRSLSVAQQKFFNLAYHHVTLGANLNWQVCATWMFVLHCFTLRREIGPKLIKSMQFAKRDVRAHFCAGKSFLTLTSALKCCTAGRWEFTLFYFS